MSFSRCAHSALFALLSLSAGVALAQDGEGLRPLDPDDVGGWLDEEQAPAAPTPGASEPSDPLAGPSAPAPTVEAELSPDERRKRGRQIDRNYDKAQEIYQGIINSDKLAPLERRIANNERLIREYNEKIRSALAERRELQVQIFNQSFYLQQQAERGQISKGTYDELIAKEEDKYERRVGDLKKDVDLWRSEVKAAKARLADLQAQRRMALASRPRKLRSSKRNGKAAGRAPVVKPGEKLLSSLRARLRQLNAFQTKHTLTNVHPRDLGSRPLGATAMASDPMGGGGDASLETPPQEDESFWED